jgi:type I restriction enzyme M protein
MAIKKSDLYSSLWASCDELRGGMEPNTRGDYGALLDALRAKLERVMGESG